MKFFLKIMFTQFLVVLAALASALIFPSDGGAATLLGLLIGFVVTMVCIKVLRIFG